MRIRRERFRDVARVRFHSDLGRQQATHVSTRREAEGSDFADVRPYQPGDDLRTLDLNTYQRLRSLWVREYHPDAGQHVGVLLDCTGSMSIGAPPKIEVAGELAALLAVIACHHGDRFDLVCLGGKGGVDVSGHSLADLPPILGALEATEPGGAKDLATGIRRQGSRGWDLAVLISDVMTRNHHEVVRALASVAPAVGVVRIVDPQDRSPSPGGSVSAVDVETGAHRPIDREIAAQYHDVFVAWEQRLERDCARHQVWHHPVEEASDLGGLLLRRLRRTGVLVVDA